MANSDTGSVYDESSINEIVDGVIKDHYRDFGGTLGLNGDEIDAEEKEALKGRIGEFYLSSFQQAYYQMAERYPDSFSLPAPGSVAETMQVVDKAAVDKNVIKEEYSFLQEKIFESPEEQAKIDRLIAEMVLHTDTEEVSAGERFDYLAENGLEISEGKIRASEEVVAEFTEEVLDSFPEYMQEHITEEDRAELRANLSENRLAISDAMNTALNANLEKYYGKELAELGEAYEEDSHEYMAGKWDLKEKAMENPAFAAVVEQDNEVFQGKSEQLFYDTARELGEKIDARISEKEKQEGKGKTSQVDDPSADPAVAAAAGLRENIQGELAQVEETSAALPGGGGEISRA